VDNTCAYEKFIYNNGLCYVNDIDVVNIPLRWPTRA